MKVLKKILYAEDEPDLKTVVELTIQSLSDYEITTYNNGQNLIDNVDKNIPDLILLDVMMPELDGPSTYMALQENENTKNIPVIFITAKAQVHEVESFNNLGSIGVIVKPFDPITLCDRINELWKDFND